MPPKKKIWGSKQSSAAEKWSCHFCHGLFANIHDASSSSGSSADIDLQLPPQVQEADNMKTKIKKKSDELKQFMQSSDSNAAMFNKQIEAVITDRLVQDFPLFEQKAPAPASASIFKFASILPLSRIWTRGCVVNATKQNKVFINIPNKRHF